MEKIEYTRSDLIDYYRWAEEKFISVIEKIPDDTFSMQNKKIDSSIRHLAMHIPMCWFMLSTKTMKEFGEQYDIVAKMSKSEILTFWRTQLNNLEEYFQNLKDQEFTNKNEEHKLYDRDLYIQMYCDHATYHRGQLAYLIKLLSNEKAPNTNFPAYYYWKD
ncbi:hypothetical protein NEF87_000783 [Candidatus Lokiarchaeum ossiferum]|uniref:Damage-inducible protein DinB n=1 Tax=Candidatus Lokiarchaeum ossiferum TaxID=2951803 RepID=A0ABY6HLW4_9ARCH|nr:hypothetical protein NEF87_000783 [Candidatus Lokiarchaeum sp. B-35]